MKKSIFALVLLAFTANFSINFPHEYSPDLLRMCRLRCNF